MKTIKIGDANQKFSDYMRMVDEEKEVSILKHGKEKYVTMTKERYDDLVFGNKLKDRLKSGMWGCTMKDGEEFPDRIVYMKSDGETVKIKLIHTETPNMIYKYGELKTPLENIRFTGEDPIGIELKDEDQADWFIQRAVTIEEGSEMWNGLQSMMNQPDYIEGINLNLPSPM